MVLVVVTRSEDVTMTWSEGKLYIVGATLNLSINMDRSQMERVARGQEGVGTADVIVNDYEDGV